MAFTTFPAPSRRASRSRGGLHLGLLLGALGLGLAACGGGRNGPKLTSPPRK